MPNQSPASAYQVFYASQTRDAFAHTQLVAVCKAASASKISFSEAFADVGSVVTQNYMASVPLNVPLMEHDFETLEQVCCCVLVVQYLNCRTTLRRVKSLVSQWHVKPMND